MAMTIETPDRQLAPDVAAKYARLRSIVRELGSVLVAWSAGVDSTLLLKVCHDELGDRAVAVTAVSESLPARELAAAQQLAAELGVRHLLVETSELANEDYASNPANRCYYCKEELYTTIWPLAEQEGLAHVANGANLDDVGDFRPGMQAARELGVRAPLLEAELGKPEIRALSYELGLPTWDKPALACLSSRIPYGSRVTKEKLEQIDRAEMVLLRHGFRQMRVRHHDEVARIEVPPADMPRFFSDGIHEKVVAALREIGFRYVTLDLQGYRSGSLNEGLPQAAPLAASGQRPGRKPLPMLQL